MIANKKNHRTDVYNEQNQYCIVILKRPLNYQKVYLKTANTPR